MINEADEAILKATSRQTGIPLTRLRELRLSGDEPSFQEVSVLVRRHYNTDISDILTLSGIRR